MTRRAVELPHGRAVEVTDDTVTYAGLSVRLSDVSAVSAWRHDRGAGVDYAAVATTPLVRVSVEWQSQVTDDPDVRRAAEQAYDDVRALWRESVGPVVVDGLVARLGSPSSPRIGPWTFLRRAVILTRLLRHRTAPLEDVGAGVDGDRVWLTYAGAPFGEASTRSSNVLLVPALVAASRR